MLDNCSNNSSLHNFKYKHDHANLRNYDL